MRALLLQAAPSVTPFEQPDEARLALRRAVQATLVGVVEMDCLLDRAEQLIARRVSTPAPAAQHRGPGRAQGRGRRPRSLSEDHAWPRCFLASELPSPASGSDGSREPERPRKVIHIDMDAFFASVEQRDNPDLRGRPVAVGGARERGVVAAASYEARRFGVRSAMPSVTARRKCPDLIFVKPRFDVYKAVSGQIRAIFAEYTPLIEPLSLDEAYLDVTENLKGIASATQIAEEIRARIRAETGLTASAGVSYNKFLAKLASDQNKPDGLFVITPAQGPAFVEACRSAFSWGRAGNRGQDAPARHPDRG